MSVTVVRGVISVILKLIMSSLSSPLASGNTWEIEFGTAFSADCWQKAVNSVNSTASCDNLKLVQFKGPAQDTPVQS